MKFKLLFVSIFVLVLNAMSSYGQVAAWDFNGENTANATSAAEVYNAGMDASNLITRGAGATASAAGNSFRTAGFQNNGIAVANTDYFQVTLSATAGNTLSLSTIDARFAGTATFAASPGVSSQFAYSLDGSTFTLIGSPQVTVGQPVTMTQISLSAITALQNVPDTVTIYLRYYASGQTPTGGWGFNSPSAGAYGLAIGGTIASSAITTRANGDWYDANTWTGFVVPTSAQNAVINHTVTNTTTLPAAIVRNAGITTTINSGASLAPGAFSYTNAGTTTVAAGGSLIIANTYTNSGTTSVSGTVQMDQGGSVATNAFSYLGTATTLVMNGSSGLFVISTPVNFWPTTASPYNVTIQGTGAQINNPVGTVAGTLTVNSQLNVSVASGLTVSGTAIANTQLNVTTANGLLITGTLQLNGGGFIGTNSPIYGASSLLKYNGNYVRNLEWTQDYFTSTIGTTPGYPNHVQITNSSTLTYYTAGNTGPKGIYGNLTIDALSALTFTGTSTVGALTVRGNVSNAGTLTLGAAVGDDLKTLGNFANTGTFNGNNRAIWFINAGLQTVSSTTVPLLIPYLVTGNVTTVQLLNAVTITAPTNGNAIAFGNVGDVIDLNGNALIIGTAGVDSVISGTGSFKGSTSSTMTLNGGTGSIGLIRFVNDLNLATLTVNRTSGAIACVLGSNLTLNQATSLNLTAGIIDLAGFTMTTEGTINNAGATNYIIADNAFGGVLRRRITATGTNYVYPIGEKTGTQEYSPATLNFSAGSFTSAYLGVSVNDMKHPNMDATNHYITRYWAVTNAGTFTSPTYTFTGNYMASGDIVGTESNSISNQWNGSAWLNNGANIVAASNTMIVTGATTLPVTNHFSAGRRDQEINIVQGSTTYLNGTIYDFGTVLSGTPVDVVFTVQNTGQLILNLGATPTMAGSAYTLFANYSPTTVPAASFSGPGTRTFTIRFTPSGAGTFTGSVTITSNDADEPSYVISFTGVGQVPSPEINIRAASGGLGNITSGNITTTDGLQNTAFGSVNLGSNVTKDFQIQNLNTATAVLTLTGTPSLVSIGGSNPGDFVVTTVPPTNSIAINSSTTFIITFTPQAAGPRSAIVSIANNDSDENPYTYLIDGTGVCLTATNTITPASGPVGTEVTITATANNLTGATVTFNGTNATPVTVVSSTQIKVTVPTGATNGNLVTINSEGCSAVNAFTVLTNLAQPCEGGYSPSDLFISEFTDSNAGALSYVEIYNGTGVTKNLSNYSVKTANNGGGYSFSLNLSNVNLASGSTYVVALGDDDICGTPGGNGSYAAQVSGSGSVNFNTNEHDHIGLFNGLSQIDSWGTFGSVTWANGLGLGSEGANFKRKTTVVAPNVTYSNSDWNIVDYAGTGVGSCANNDYTNMGNYTMTVGVAPTVTTHPSYTPTCKATTLTVAGTEGYNAIGDTMELDYQWYVVAPNTANWTALTNNATYSGVTTATLDIYDVSALVGYQYYCQIRENTATCYAASNAVMITAGQSTTWNGTGWSNGLPTLDKAVVINGNYDTATHGSFEACSVTVNGGFTLDIKANNYVSIKNDLTVNTTGILAVANNGSLVMIEDDGVVTNNGTTTVVRTTAPFELYDYTYWSSPVDAASISSTFTGWRTDYSFEFNTANFSDTNTIDYNGTVTNPGVADSFDDFFPWAWLNYTGTMTNGKGYAIMGPTGLAFGPSAATSVTFSGKVNNGVITPSIFESGNPVNTADDFNLIGNPYPSAIWANKFITDNGAKTSGSLYFWTHVDDVSISNPGPNLYNFITDDYAVYNLTGGTRASFTGSAVPTGYIASGQGFFVEAQGNNVLTFNNSMRDKGYNNTQFFRSSAQQQATSSRIWLNLRNADGLFGQLLVGYFPDTSLGHDWAYDARVNQSNNYLSFYSLTANEKYKIQARPAFDDSDIVPLGYFSSINGEFSISIDQKEGILADDATNIYLQDLEMNIIHDLKASPYTFTTGSGKFESRFLLRYTDSALNTIDFDTLDNSVVVATNEGEMTIKSYLQALDEVIIYDVLGRQLFEAKGIAANNFNASGISMSQQSLIVKIKLESGAIVTKKVLW